MKLSVATWILLFLMIAAIALVSGCSTEDPDNASVRPWNAPQGWENGLNGMNYQHE